MLKNFRVQIPEVSIFAANSELCLSTARLVTGLLYTNPETMEDGMFDLPDYSQIEDETFPPLPPPDSPDQERQNNGDPFANGDEDGEVSKLADVPVAKKKSVKRPQPKLDSQRLTSDRGLPALRTLFEDVRFKGKGHEAADLRLLMQKMENWAHRLYPKLQFEDFIDKVEKLGSKKEVQTCLKRIRLDMPLTHDDFVGEEAAREPLVFGDPDPFSNDLLQPVHSTPAPTAPTTPATPSLTEEQRRRMELNRQKALERRLARQQQEQQQTTTTDSSEAKPLDSSLSADESVAASSENALNNPETQDDIEDLSLDLVSSSTQQPSQTGATDSDTPEETRQTSKLETSKEEEPSRVEPSEEEPGRVEPSEEEPGRVEPGRVEPSEEEPGRVEPSEEEPSEEEPGRVEEPSKVETSPSPVHHINSDCEDEE